MADKAFAKTFLQRIKEDFDSGTIEDSKDVEDLLMEVLGPARDYGVKSVSTFAESGVMTPNKGVVLRTNDGTYQLTIVKSR